MKGKRLNMLFIAVVVTGSCAVVMAGENPELSIYEVQFTADPAVASPYASEIRDVAGGVVTHIWHGFNKRVYLRDPSQPTWGAVVVKDGEGGELADNVSLGDWVSFEVPLLRTDSILLR